MSKTPADIRKELEARLLAHKSKEESTGERVDQAVQKLTADLTKLIKERAKERAAENRMGKVSSYLSLRCPRCFKLFAIPGKVMLSFVLHSLYTSRAKPGKVAHMALFCSDCEELMAKKEVAFDAESAKIQDALRQTGEYEETK